MAGCTRQQKSMEAGDFDVRGKAGKRRFLRGVSMPRLPKLHLNPTSLADLLTPMLHRGTYSAYGLVNFAIGTIELH